MDTRIQQSLLDEALHSLENGDDPTQKSVDAPIDEERGLVVAHGVVAVVLLPLLSERFFEGDGHGDSEAGNLDHEVGAAVEVKVGELPEGALHLEQAQGFVVEHEDTCLACCEGGKGARRGA